MPEHTEDLTLTGRLVIWASRHWLRARRRGRGLPGFVVHTLDQLPDGLGLRTGLERLLGHLATGARRPLAFAAPETRSLTPDESTLLLALVAARLDLDSEVRTLLAEHQHRRGLDQAISSLCRLAGRMQRSGLNLCALEGRLAAVTDRATPQPAGLPRPRQSAPPDHAWRERAGRYSSALRRPASRD